MIPHHRIKHVVSNSSSLTSDHDSVSVSCDASSGPTSIEYVGAELSIGCKCSQNSSGKLNTIHAKEENDTYHETTHIEETLYGQCCPPCSVPITKCHCMFDFAKQLHMPHHSGKLFPDISRLLIVCSYWECVMKHTHNRSATSME